MAQDDTELEPELTRLLGWDLDLAAPGSLAERWDVAGAATDAPDNQVMIRVLAAALGLCWGRFRRNPKSPKYDGRVLAFGGRVLDFALEHGAPLHHVITAGGRALQLCRAGLVTQEAIDDAAGFSPARTAG